MGAPKPCLGYPSRTAAIAALRAVGKDTREIAALVGVKTSTVKALEGSASAIRQSSATPRRPKGARREIEDGVMDLWDQGFDAEQIGEQLGIGAEYAARILYYMRDGLAERSFSDEAIASSTEALLAALRRHHPDRCGA